MVKNETKQKEKKPDDHVLDIHNSRIDIRDLINRIDQRLREKRDGKISS